MRKYEKNTKQKKAISKDPKALGQERIKCRHIRKKMG